MRILITGRGSYIGTHIKTYLSSFGHTVDEADTIGDEWQKIDYSKYDAVVHVAAIVHQNAKSACEDAFRAVNTELPVKIARLAKESGVSQFVFLSTMGVYGVGKTLSASDSVIKSDTPLKAVGGYGGSKLEAEKQLLEDGGIVPLLLRRVLYMKNDNLEGLALYFLGARIDFTRAYWAE